MIIISGSRQAGKTTKLIELAAKHGGYIVCTNQDEASAIFHYAKDLGLLIDFPITHDEFINKRYYGRNIKQFYIDNADMLLQRISQVPIMAISVTKDSM